MSAKLTRSAAVLFTACTAALALPGMAHAAGPNLGPAVGPNQYFTGTVTGVATSGSATSDVIGVLCAGPASTGSPRPGQTVEVKLAVPPITPTFGFTGSAAKSIEAELIWSTSNPPIVVITPIDNFTQYSTPLAIPTNIKVPCSGPGEVDFVPQPGSSTAVPYVVHITFQSTGV